MTAIVLWLVTEAINTIQAQILFGTPGTVMERFSHAMAASELLLALFVFLAMIWKPYAILLTVAVQLAWTMHAYVNVGIISVVPQFVWIPLISAVLTFAFWHWNAKHERSSVDS